MRKSKLPSNNSGVLCDRLAIANVLLCSGANPCVIDAKGRTPLDMALESEPDNIHLIDLLKNTQTKQ